MPKTRTMDAKVQNKARAAARKQELRVLKRQREQAERERKLRSKRQRACRDLVLWETSRAAAHADRDADEVRQMMERFRTAYLVVPAGQKRARLLADYSLFKSMPVERLAGAALVAARVRRGLLGAAASCSLACLLDLMLVHQELHTAGALPPAAREWARSWWSWWGIGRMPVQQYKYWRFFQFM